MALKNFQASNLALIQGQGLFEGGIESSLYRGHGANQGRCLFE